MNELSKYYSKIIVYFKSVEENKNGTNDCEMRTDKTQFKEREGRGCYHQRKQRDQERLICPMVPWTHGLMHSIRTETQHLSQTTSPNHLKGLSQHKDEWMVQPHY